MRLLCLLPSPLDVMPGQRYRIEQWEPLLRGRGVTAVFRSFKSAELHAILCEPGRVGRKLRLCAEALCRRVADVSHVREFDAVYVYSEAAIIGPPLVEFLVKCAKVPLVFDFDDAIFLPSAGSANGAFRRLRFPGKTGAICRWASHVIAGNAYLADYARRFNDRVTVVPSTVDTERYRVERRGPGNAPPVIGWSGSFSTLQYLRACGGMLQKLARRERFRLRVIGAGDFRLDGVETEAVPWCARTEVADLRPCDIGIMPLPDNRWTHGKCGMKALQYMALGIPTVCSPVGVNSSIIRDGENGFVAATEGEWVEKLTRLLRSPPLRDRLGRAGRSTVEDKYALSLHAPRVHQIFQSVIPARACEGPSPALRAH